MPVPSGRAHTAQEEASAFRLEMVERFGIGAERAAYLYDERNYLDQSACASCSFVGFLQLMSLSAAIEELDELLPKRAQQSADARWRWWKTNWADRWYRWALHANLHGKGVGRGRA
eukprot:SAG11_NODE_17921_length_505_cov_1.150246_1_plen_115_part_01